MQKRGNFTLEDCFNSAIEYHLQYDFTYRHPVKIGQNYYSDPNGVLAPLSCYFSYRDISVFDISMFGWFYKNAELMRLTLIDESIPLASPKVIFDVFDGCRRTNAIALGMLKYHPALPEFREAMIHERDSRLKELCVFAMGEMSNEAQKYKKDIRQCILDSDDGYFQEEAIRALVKLGDREAVPLLRDLFEETRYKINQFSYEEFPNDKHGYGLLIEEIVSALIKFDIGVALEVLAIGLADGNSHINHFVSRAFVLTRHRHQMKLMDLFDSVLVGFLPKDPKWTFSNRLLK